LLLFTIVEQSGKRKGEEKKKKGGTIVVKVIDRGEETAINSASKTKSMLKGGKEGKGKKGRGRRGGKKR